MLHLPRIMLAAPSSGSGKTMITCGILQAFVNRGLRPASFKCGPDYIDPMFHEKIIRAASRNLDTFFTEDRVTRCLFARTAARAGISVLEGVMGIYDGLGGISARASSYELAAVTDTPIILVVNGRGMSLSVIPLIQGYLAYQERLGNRLIRGVILNRTTEMMYLRLKKAIEEQTGIRLFGYVPELKDCVIESRHLGLVTPGEIADLRQKLERLGRELEHSLDLDGILRLADEARDYESETLRLPEGVLPAACPQQESDTDVPPRIAVAEDEAFCFYYPDNLELLEQLGAELVPFSPLQDDSLPPDTDALLLGGGYPELYARQLSGNTGMRSTIARRICEGIPYLAECGGFLYLHDTLDDMDGQSWPMCGVIRGHAFRTPKLSRFGYISLSQRTEGAGFLPAGQTIRAHEFHYYDSDDPGEDFLAQKPDGNRKWNCIHADSRSMAGYPHLYYWSNPQFAEAFIKCAGAYRKRRKMSAQAPQD